ncbi:ImuA family protein [Aliidiomarina sanyensis]|uniref:Translesion DNA synthesis-associated protein ImuA n=1 Tax=Aliidiomarina sanyensis TaxID=1249555 RepID=A0A432WBV2_9GAMM|nr:hypothetical protein [Aliidiomarina sanyensis]RUO29533.1 hypothetical protein CWE11_09810 [Aliidiomarina sanyensis]
MQPQLQQLMESGALWQGHQSQAHDAVRASTGDALLDQALAGGWVRGRVHELQLPHSFCGELTLFGPAMQQAAKQGVPIFWIAPPAIPNAPALASMGENAQHIVLSPIQASDALWAAETILHSRQAGMILLWAKDLSATATRRLHLAASESDAFVFVLTGWQPEDARSYGTRLRLHHENEYIQWQLLKRHGGWPIRMPRQPLPTWLRYTDKPSSNTAGAMIN